MTPRYLKNLLAIKQKKGFISVNECVFCLTSELGRCLENASVRLGTLSETQFKKQVASLSGKMNYVIDHVCTFSEYSARKVVDEINEYINILHWRHFRDNIENRERRRQQEYIDNEIEFEDEVTDE